MRQRGEVAAWLAVLLSCGGAGGGSADGSPGFDAVEGGTDVPDALAGDAAPSEEGADGVTRPEPGSCEPNAAPFPVRPEPPIPATLPFLRVDGRDIVNEDGAPVALRGVNFGSWLLVESWIAGIGVMDEGDLLETLDARAAELGVADLLEAAKAETALEWTLEMTAHRVLVERWRQRTLDAADEGRREAVLALWAWFDDQPWVFEERSLWEWLERRFGAQGARDLRRAFQDHFITEADVAQVAALGLNAIRVPVFYLNLESDVKGDNAFDEEGFRRLDTLALWARKHGVYLILDLHGAAGGQSTAWHTGLPDGGSLWERPECIARTARLWKALASYFAGDPHVAAYDLLNEPMSVQSAQQYREVHDVIYRAIREADPAHIVMVEDGYKAPGVLVSPREMGWENAMFSIHLYVDPPAKPGDYAAALERSLRVAETYYEYSTRYDCPLLLGEFNPETDALWGPAAMDAALAALNRRGVHWTVWTWKYAWPGSMWGVLTKPEGEARPVDVGQGTFQEVLAGFEGLDSAEFVVDTEYAGVLKSRAADRVMPLRLGEIHETRVVEAWPGGAVRVGVGKRPVTPEFEPYDDQNGSLRWEPGEPFDDRNANGVLDTLWMGGMGPRQPTGVLDDLWARAVAFDFGGKAVVVVAVDTLGVSMRRADAIRRRVVKGAPAGLDVAAGRIVIAATHTHAGPDTIGIFGPDDLTAAWDGAYLDFIEDQATAAALEALGSLREARLFFAEGACGADCVVDPDPPEHTDPYVGILQARDVAGGEVIATLVSVANHPEALWGRNTLISSDFPHVLRERIEADQGGMAVYVSADEGLMQTPAKDVPEGPDRMDHIGNLYADAVLAALGAAVEVPPEAPVTFGQATIPTRLDNVGLYVAVQLDIAEGYKEYLYWIEDDPMCGDMGCLDVPVTALRLGDVATVVTFPGEVVPELVTGEITTPWELGDALVYPNAPHEPALVDHLATPGRFVVGLANAEVGYIYPKCTYAPAAIGSQIHGGGPDAAMAVMSGVASLLDAVNEAHGGQVGSMARENQ